MSDVRVVLQLSPAPSSSDVRTSHRGAQPVEDLARSAAGRISPQPALSSCRSARSCRIGGWHARQHARSSALALLEPMARCGAERGQCSRTKGERGRASRHRASRKSVSVRRGLPSATRPPPAGRQGTRLWVSAADRAARAIDRGRTRGCAQRPGRTKDVRTPSRCQAARICHSAERVASWASPPVEARACCHPKRVASLTNPSVFRGRARCARTCACAALVWAHAPVRGRTWEASPAQFQPMTRE